MRKKVFVPNDVIFVPGKGVIKVEHTLDSAKDGAGNSYVYNRTLNIWRLEGDKKTVEGLQFGIAHEGDVRTDNKGDTWRYQPNPDNDFELEWARIKGPTQITSLSPTKRTGQGGQHGSLPGR